MPEIKHNFTGGKMEKDLDERIVPNGQYRDALNIEVSTSEGSDVGTVQNILGNKLVTIESGTNFSIQDSDTCVGIVSDEKSDTIYWLIHGSVNPLQWSANLSGGFNINPITSKNYIVEYNKPQANNADSMQLVLVDIYRAVDNLVDHNITYGNNYIKIGVLNFGVLQGVRVGARLTKVISQQQGAFVVDAEVLELGIPNDPDGSWLQLSNIPPQLQNFINAGDDIALEFYNPKVLGFNSQTRITGINIIDNLLFFTDNENEPKRINIERSKIGTQSFNKHTGHPNPTNVAIIEPITEHHITVIKKGPTMAPRLDMKAKKVNNINGTLVHDFVGVGIGHKIPNLIITNSDPSQTLVNSFLDYQVGERIQIKDSTSVVFASEMYPILAPNGVFEITAVNNVTNTIIDIDVICRMAPSKEGTIAWAVDLQQTTPEMFEDKFVQFATRYKYVDGEYSTFSPFSEYAFVPGKFEYNPKKGFNLGMENKLLSVDIKDFVPKDIPTDVIQVDILYKESMSPNIYLAKSIKHTDIAPQNADYWSKTPGITTPTISWTDSGGNIHGGYYSAGDLNTIGSYTIDSESTVSVLPSNQILRHFDNVPRIALSQEVTANRLVYGNYLQNYNITKNEQNVTPIFDIELDRRFRQPAMSPQSSSFLHLPLRSLEWLEGYKSIKSMREYQIGVVYIDEYGRKTPVITDSSGIIKVEKRFSKARTKIMANITNHPTDIPDFAKYFKYYIKETSSEYYNLAMDRFYDAEDDNIWLSFFSSDRNKVDLDTTLQLKKRHYSQEAIKGDNKIKIVAIENEAPEYIKRTKNTIGEWDLDTTDVFDFGGGAGAGVNNLPFADATYPIYLDATAVTNEGVNKLEEIPNLAFRMIRKDMTQNLPIGIITNASDWYKVSVNLDVTNNYLMQPEKRLGDDMAFTGDGTTLVSDLFLEIIEFKAENKPEFDGRFFVKVKNDNQIQLYVQNLKETDVVWDVVSQRSFGYYHRDTAYAGADPTGVGLINFNVTGTGPDGFDTNNPSATNCSYTGGQYDFAPWISAFNSSTAGTLAPGGCIQSTDMYTNYTSNPGICGYSQWIIDALPSAGFLPGNNSTFNTDNSDPEYNPGDPTDDDSLGFEGIAGNQTGTATDTVDLSFCGIMQTEAADGGVEGKILHNYEWEHPSFGGDFGENLKVGNALVFMNDPQERIYYILDITTKDLFNYIEGPNMGYTQHGSWSSQDLWFQSPANFRKRFRIKLDRPVEQIHPTNPAPEWALPTVNDCSTTMKIRILSPRPLGVEDTSKATNKPAIFETEPKIKEDLDIFYEASNLLPLELNRKNFGTIVKPGMTTSLHETQLKTTKVRVNGAVVSSVNIIVHDLIDEDGNEVIVGQPLVLATGGVINSTWPAWPLVTAIDPATNTITLNQTQDFVDSAELQFGVPGLGGPPGELDVTPIQNSSSTNDTGTEITAVKVVDDELSITVKNINCSHPFQAAGGAPDGGLLHVAKGDLIRIWDVDSDSFMTFSLAHNYWDAPQPGDTHNGFTPVGLTGVNNQVLANTTLFNFNGEGWVNISEQPGYPNEIELRLDLKPPTHVSLNWFNCYSFGNGVESDRIRDDFNQPTLDNGAIVSTISKQQYEEELRKNGLIYSGLYNSTSGVNNLNQFITAEKITKDLNPIYGSIQKLHTRDSNLIVLCEDKILKVLANKDALYNADGNPQLLSTNRVLGEAQPYAGEYGISRNPESFASESYRAYFTDKQRGVVMRLSKDGLTPISEHGMKNWFRENLPLGNKLIGSYDTRKDSYHLTIGEGNEAQTISFNERVRGWESKKSFIPEFGTSLHNNYYTIKKAKLWKHYDHPSGKYNNFYGVPYHSSFTAVLNDFSGSVKTFNTLNYEGSQSRIVQFQEQTVGITTYNDDQYYNLNPNDGWYVSEIITDIGKSTQQEGMVDEFIEKEGKWFNYIKGKEDLVVQNWNLDPNEFTFQGIGIAQNISVASLMGCMDANAQNFENWATTPCCVVCDGSDDNYCCIPCETGCMDPSALNYDPNATCNDECEYSGCTDPIMFNYDPNATQDDGSCYPVIYGCTVPIAQNYIPPVGDVYQDVNTPCCTVCDGSDTNGCCQAFVSGCTDSNACNYNASANTDDGSCDYSCYGCTDPTACNYDPLATIDNNTCVACNYACLNPVANNYENPVTSSFPNLTPCDANNMGCFPPACTGPGTGLGQCCDTPLPPGCTDSNAVNFMGPNTSYTDDGSCCYASGSTVNFQVERIGCNNTLFGDNPDVNGYCDDGAGYWASYVGNTNVGIDNYGACIGLGGWAVLNFDPLACADCSGIEGGTDFDCCEEHVYGCTDPLALNPDCGSIQSPGSQVPCNDGVTIDDGTCVYSTDYGCTDPTACNWCGMNISVSPPVPNCTIDDGSCEHLSCEGCTDSRYGFHPDINGMSNFDGSGSSGYTHHTGDSQCTWCPATPQTCPQFDLANGTACTDDGTIHGKPIGFFAQDFDPTANPLLPANLSLSNSCNYTSGCPDKGYSAPEGWMIPPSNMLSACDASNPASVCFQLNQGVGWLNPINSSSTNLGSGPAINFAGSTQYLDANGSWPSWNTSWVLAPHGPEATGPYQGLNSSVYHADGMGNYTGDCIPRIRGCIDPVGPNGEINYSLNRGCNTQTWAYATPFGDGSPVPFSSDPLAQPNVHDQSCCLLQIFGCTDPTAGNYEITATMDDGSCCYGPGCPWPNTVYQLNTLNQTTYTNNDSWSDIVNAASVINLPGGGGPSEANCTAHVAYLADPINNPAVSGGVLNCYGVTTTAWDIEGTGTSAASPGNGIQQGEVMVLAANGGNECESGLTPGVVWANSLVNNEGLMNPDTSNSGAVPADGSGTLNSNWFYQGLNGAPINNYVCNNLSGGGGIFAVGATDCCCTTLGCSDPLAMNFNPNVCMEDTSLCVYSLDPSNFCAPWDGVILNGPNGPYTLDGGAGCSGGNVL